MSDDTRTASPDWPSAAAFVDLGGAKETNDGAARLVALAICDERGNPTRDFAQSQWAHFYYEFELMKDILAPIAGLAICTLDGTVVHGKNTMQFGIVPAARVRRGTHIRIHQAISLELAPGAYTLNVGFASSSADTIEGYIAERLTFVDVESNVRQHCRVTGAGMFYVGYAANGSLLHHGFCNLPSVCTARLVEGTSTSIEQGEPAKSNRQAQDAGKARLVYLASYPRSGNTWIRNLVEFYFDRRASSLYREPGTVNLEESPDGSYGQVFETYETRSEPRQRLRRLVNNCGPVFSANFRANLASFSDHFFLKTHELPFESYFDHEAVIYVVRHPAATIWSLFNFLQSQSAGSSEPQALEQIIRGNVEHGSWSHHAEEWLNRGKELGDRFVLLRYEELGRKEAEICLRSHMLTGLRRTMPLGLFPDFSHWHALAPSFYRAGKPDEWRDHLQDSHIQLIKSVHGHTMEKLGYTFD